MPRLRAAALLLAVPVAFATPASADPTVPGCWGAANHTYCDATLRVGAGSGTNPTPVCAGSCVYVGVPSVRPNDTFQVCLDYRTPSGHPATECAVEANVSQIRDDMSALERAVLQVVVCQLPKSSACDSR